MDKYNVAKEILKAYTDGIWLASEKIKNTYLYTLLGDYEEKKFVYDGELTLTTQKTEFERCFFK